MMRGQMVRGVYDPKTLWFMDVFQSFKGAITSKDRVALRANTKIIRRIGEGEHKLPFPTGDITEDQLIDYACKVAEKVFSSRIKGGEI